MDSCTAVAFPGLPVVFAEGFRDYGRRISAHSHASFALTDVDGKVGSETTARKAVSTSFTLNGAAVDGPRARGVIKLAADMMSAACAAEGVAISSVNNGIYSGSSDSGAAAAVVALDGLFGLGLSRQELCVRARAVSETAYRSVYGGLSECLIGDGGAVSTGLIAGRSFFRKVSVFACPFDVGRYSADELHLKVVAHPEYHLRARQAEDGIALLEKHVQEGRVDCILRLMESEAKTVHRMFEGVGLTVIKPPMRRLCDVVEGLRSDGVEAYWNAAGGSVVYVFTAGKGHSKVVEQALDDMGVTHNLFKVAGPAKVI